MEVLGYTGGGLLAVQMWPQIYRVVQKGDASQLSWWMLASNVSGLSLMGVYGFLKADIPLCSTAIISLCNISVLSALKMRYTGSTQ